MGFISSCQYIQAPSALLSTLSLKFSLFHVSDMQVENTLQPIDFVGETELPIGLYTYELDVSAEGDVILEFKID